MTLVYWGTEPWQWFICQCTILTAKSAREQERNKRAEGKYLGLKLFWKFLIKKSITKQKKCCLVSKAMYTGLQQEAKSFIFKAVITDKNRNAFFFPPLENPRQIGLLIWFYRFQEITLIIGRIGLWYRFSNSVQSSLLRKVVISLKLQLTKQLKNNLKKQQGGGMLLVENRGFSRLRFNSSIWNI